MAALVPLKRLRSNAIAARAPKSELLYFTTIAKLCAHYRHLYMADDIAHLYMADDIAPLSLWISTGYFIQYIRQMRIRNSIFTILLRYLIYISQQLKLQ
jgi:hypothetical protein